MADEDTQARDESLWWAFDASSDSSLPTATFDEPLEWPDALPWEEFDAGLPRHADLPDPDHLDLDLLFPPTDPVTAVEPGRSAGGGQGDGDGGEPTQLHMESLPESIWAADPAAPDEELPRLVTITGSIFAADAPAAAPVYAEAERAKGGRWPGWLTVPRGNAAVVALISLVSLVLLGMFLSVRARNDVPTETSRTPVTSADIVATRPLNTVPLSPATTGPPATIALSDLIPPADGTATADTGSSGAGTTPRTAAPATTTPRATAPAGGGDSTQPTTATTAAPPPPQTDTTTATTSPPDTTPTTRRTTTTVDMPSPTFTIPDFTIPTVTTRPTVRGN